MGTFSSLATETGASVIISHHLRKLSQGMEISPENVRDMVRGSSALVDGVRCAFVLWPADDNHKKEVSHKLSKDFLPQSIYWGMVVKSNHGAKSSIRTYVRDEFTGLLKDRTQEINSDYHNYPDMLYGAIVNAAKPWISLHAHGGFWDL